MVAILTALITGWHLLLLRPAWSAARRQIPPRPVEFAIASFVVYYDVGLWLDVLGVEYGAPGFRPFSEADSGVRLAAYSALVLVPLVLLLAARLARPKGLVWAMAPARILTGTQERILLALFTVSACVAIGLSLSAVYVGGSIPDARLVLSQWLGPGVVLLYLPLDIAIYYPLTARGRGRRGVAVSLLLAFAASIGMIGLGQRTLLLLPFLVIIVCRVRFRAAPFLAAAGVALLLVVALGLVFKPSGLQGADDPSIVATINESMARAPVMAAAIEWSEPFGTSVMEYPGEGYVYAALFFVPRPIAPFKGESTAQRFTDAIEGSDRYGRWAYGSGMIEEAILNVGLALALLVVAGIGLVLGALEGVVARRSALIVPASGAAFWLCGYHLPAILVLFGLMFIVVLAIDMLASRYGDGGDGFDAKNPEQTSPLGKEIDS